MAKLPSPDLDRIASQPVETVEVRQVLWRLHAPNHADHPMRWNQLRSVGPLTSARFDPWPPPTADHDPEGVGYFGLDIPTCIGEIFGQTRTVNPDRGGYQLTAFTPARPLRLMDLRGGWPISIGASHLINSGPKNRCRTWAQALRSVFPDPDGLLYTGVAGRECVVLWEPPGADAFPGTPQFSRPLSDPAMASRIADACRILNFTYLAR